MPVDTIHNHRNTLAQEVIYEVEASEEEEAVEGKQLSRASSQSTLKPEPNETMQVRLLLCRYRYIVGKNWVKICLGLLL